MTVELFSDFQDFTLLTFTLETSPMHLERPVCLCESLAKTKVQDSAGIHTQRHILKDGFLSSLSLAIDTNTFILVLVYESNSMAL